MSNFESDSNSGSSLGSRINGGGEGRGSNKWGVGWKHEVKSNKQGGRNKQGGGGGNFDKIKRKGLFRNEIQFWQMDYLILPLNRKNSAIIASQNYDITFELQFECCIQ